MVLKVILMLLRRLLPRRSAGGIPRGWLCSFPYYDVPDAAVATSGGSDEPSLGGVSTVPGGLLMLLILLLGVPGPLRATSARLMTVT